MTNSEPYRHKIKALKVIRQQKAGSSCQNEFVLLAFPVQHTTSEKSPVLRSEDTCILHHDPQETVDKLKHVPPSTRPLS